METYTLYLLIEGIIFVFFSQILLCFFVRKGTDKIIIVLALFTLILNLNMLILLPYDIYISNVLDINPELEVSFHFTKQIMKISYKVLYWSIFFCKYLLIPLIKKYENSGEYTRWEKFKSSIKRNLLFYGAIILIALVLYVWAWLRFPKEQLDIFQKNVFKINYIYGQSIVLFLLSYSIVKLPKNIYNKINYEKMINYYEWSAKNIRDKLYIVRNDLKESGYKLLSTLENLKIDKEMKKDKYFDTNTKINKKSLNDYEKYIQESFDYLYNNSKTFGIEIKKDNIRNNEEAIKDYKSLFKLNKNLKQYQWDNLRLQSEIQNIYKHWSILINILLKTKKNKPNNLKIPLYSQNPQAQNHKEISQTDTEDIIFDKNENGFISSQNISSFKIWYYINLRKILLIFFSIISFILCIATILSEISINLPWNLSLFGFLINNASNVFILHIFALFPVIFLFSMSLYTLFKLKISGYFGMYGNRQTDSMSLIFFCSILCKVIFPLCLNISLMIEEKDKETSNTILAENFGINNHIQIIKIFNSISPLIFIGLVLINVFNLFTRFGKCLGVNDFDILNEKRDSDIQEGYEYLMSLNKQYLGQMIKNTYLIDNNYLSSESIDFERMKTIENRISV